MPLRRGDSLAGGFFYGQNGSFSLTTLKFSQNFYCLSMSYKGVFKNTDLFFWME